MIKDNGTEVFWSTFSGGGTIAATCLCGRVHFVDSGNADFDEHELEEYRKNRDAKPDRYIGHFDCDFISVADMPGGVLCYACPCGTANKYEDFLRIWRNEILEYYGKILSAEKRQTQSLEAGLEAVKTK
jgi:hypothetical protein